MSARLALVTSSVAVPPIRTAVIGVGYFGRLHAHSYAILPDCDLAALIDPEPDTKMFAERLGVAWYADVDELPSDVRAVSVATPVDAHYPIARQLLERGVDVAVATPTAPGLVRLSNNDIFNNSVGGAIIGPQLISAGNNRKAGNGAGQLNTAQITTF